jgi:hypothetical protein
VLVLPFAVHRCYVSHLNPLCVHCLGVSALVNSQLTAMTDACLVPASQTPGVSAHLFVTECCLTAQGGEGC